MDEELRFKAETRCNKLLGLWAGGRMGLTSSEAEAYAKEVAIADLEEPGGGGVIRKILEDFEKRRLRIAEEEIQAQLDSLYPIALKQISEEYPEALQKLFQMGMNHYQAGHPERAKYCCQQILQVQPNHADANHLLGILALKAGNHHVAVELVSKAIQADPDVAFYHNNLGLALQREGRMGDAAEAFKEVIRLAPGEADAFNNLGNSQKDMGLLDEAARSYEEALRLQPGYEDAHNNLGIVLQKQGRLDEAVRSYKEALRITPDNPRTLNNLGTALKEQGFFDEAAETIQKALEIKPDYAEAMCNLGIVTQEQGRLDEAVRIFQTALEKKPESILIANCLIDILNHHMPSAGTRGAYAKAQEDLQGVTPKYIGMPVITDETVQQLYEQCHSILSSHKLSSNGDLSQIFRGVYAYRDCGRHVLVFNTSKIIPEHCFGCYKVSIEPRTVVELIKLMLVFDNLELPRDNTRKCMIEFRPEISGTYKGIVYCKSLAEGKEILKVVQAKVGEKISKKIPISVRRGCSEFSIAYPEYGRIEDNAPPLMTYDEEWREYEDYVDKNLAKHRQPHAFDTHNHSGVTLCDALVMRKWLEYAAAIGDLSYLKVSGLPVQKMKIEPRAPFTPVEDE